MLTLCAASVSGCLGGPGKTYAQRQHENRQEAYNTVARKGCNQSPDIDAQRACEDKVGDNSLRHGVVPSTLPKRN